MALEPMIPGDSGKFEQKGGDKQIKESVCLIMKANICP